MRNLCVVQARMSSKRFPGKVLAPFGDSTVLRVLLSRLNQSNLIDKVVVATSTEPSDDVLVEHIPNQEVLRGDLLNVRSRYIELERKYRPKNIIRITADCPLVCFELVDKMIDFHEVKGSEYTANCNLDPYPKGFDIEVFNAEILTRPEFLTQDSYQIEHVTPWMYQNHGLKVTNLLFSQHERTKDLNFSVDTPGDLHFLNEIEAKHSVAKLTFNQIWAVLMLNH
jgi:spore coat polysaccharide biosynthesis protein SpsF (cytidylyltransferase family)